MDDYKKVLEKKITLMVCLNGLIVVFLALISIWGHMTVIINEPISDMISGFQTGIFIGLQIFMLVYITKYRKALKDKAALKKLYIEEHDERTKHIKDKIGGVGFNFSLGAIATASIMAGFFNEIIFFTLFSVLFFMSLVKGSLKVYYRNKF